MAVGLILASASPRRREILSHLQLPFVVRPANVDETPLAGETPPEIVLRLSRAKAAALNAHNVPAGDSSASAASAIRDTIVIAADTTVALDGLIIGKPKDAAEAEQILRQLRGKMHQVFTGLTLAPPQGQQWSVLCETRVHMRAYADDELLAYVASGEVYDKAGAYAIQAALFHPVERIEGCYMNVMGLPLCEVIRGLRALGIETGKTEPIQHDTL